MIGRRRRVWRPALNALRPPPAVSDPPLVSVVTATYNWSEVLRLAIRSVRAQTYPRWELIVVGDAARTTPPRWSRSFGDPRITWHNRAVNSGSQSLPNNDGIALAQGELIAYLGHDDLWAPDHLVRLVAAQRRTRMPIVRLLDQRGDRSLLAAAMRNLTGLFSRDHQGGHLPPSSVLHRRQLSERIGGWRDYGISSSAGLRVPRATPGAVVPPSPAAGR